VLATLEQGNGLISLFWKHLYEQFFHAELWAPPGLHFAWTRERDLYTGQISYKVLVLLNARSFNGLYGRNQKMDGARSDCLAGCIARAWGQALRLPGPAPLELVSFPTDPCTGEPHAVQLSQADETAWQRLFTDTSNLCKDAGKPHGQGFCAFRTSNRVGHGRHPAPA